MVKAETNTPDALLEALKAGHFYATQGPEIHGIEMADKRITVRCSAAQNVIVMGRGHAALATHGASMTHATLPLAEFADSPWIRVMVPDRAGLHGGRPVARRGRTARRHQDGARVGRDAAHGARPRRVR